MKQFLFVDICNTLANVNLELERRGIDTSIYPADVSTDLWGDQSVFSEAEPIFPVIEFVREQAKRFEVVYLTARPGHIREVTLDWLNRYQLPPGPIIHTTGYMKAEFLKVFLLTEKVVGIVEDAPHEIQEITRMTPAIPLYIPDWPYNQHIAVGYRINLDEITTSEIFQQLCQLAPKEKVKIVLNEFISKQKGDRAANVLDRAMYTGEVRNHLFNQLKKTV